MSSPVSGRGEFRTTAPVEVTINKAVTFADKKVKCSNIDGRAIFEGDIILTDLGPEFNPALEGVAITGEIFRWPNSTVAFRIDAGLPNPERVNDAIAHWEAHTNLRFKVRTTEVDFVSFVPGGGCSANVGRQGGEQFVTLGPGCTTGNAIHEIGHTIGLWHEQSREDRDHFIEIVFDNIQEDFRHNFDQHITDGDDIGDYDYGSIMHYPAQAFAIDPAEPTLRTPHGEPIGQRTGLSAGDIAAANALYPNPPA